MDKLIEKTFDLGEKYGPVGLFLGAIIIGLVWLVVFFAKRELKRFTEEKVTIVKREVQTCETTLTEASDAFVAHVTASISSLKSELSLTKLSVNELQKQITQEMLNMRAHSLDIQRQNETTRKETKELLGKVTVIEKNQDQYNVIFKQIIEKSRKPA